MFPMSRAFIRESDDAPELPLPRRRESPAGTLKQPAPEGPPDQVRLGATVTIRDADGESTFEIVTPEQADPAGYKISWQSPLAQAILHARQGDRVTFRDVALEIVRVVYSRI